MNNRVGEGTNAARVSKHGAKRIRSRMGIPKKSVDNQFRIALEKGLRHCDTQGNLKKWMTRQTLGYGKKGIHCILHNGHCFITHNFETLITVIPIPSNLQKIVTKTFNKKKDTA